MAIDTTYLVNLASCIEKIGKGKDEETGLPKFLGIKIVNFLKTNRIRMSTFLTIENVILLKDSSK